MFEKSIKGTNWLMFEENWTFKTATSIRGNYEIIDPIFTPKPVPPPIPPKSRKRKQNKRKKPTIKTQQST